MENIGASIRCAVRIADHSGSRPAVASAVRLDGIRVELPAGEDDALSPGHVLELDSQTPPLGPIRASAQVASMQSASDHRGRSVVSASLKFLDLSESQRLALKGRLESLCPVVMLLGFEGFLDTAEWESVRVIEAIDAEDAVTHLDQENVAVFAIGPRLHPEQMRSILARSIEEFPGNSTLNILSGVGADAEPFQSFIDDDRIFYLSRGPLGIPELRELILSAAGRSAGRREDARGVLTAATSDRALEFCTRACLQVDTASIGALLAQTAREEIAADAAQFFLYDRAKQALTSTDAEMQRVETAAAGLVGYVSRTGKPIRIERVGDDPRYDVEADNPGAERDARFVAEPLFDAQSAVVGVVSATRDGAAEPFSAEEASRIATLAACAAPSLCALLAQDRARAMLLERTRTATPNLDIFRQEALDSHAKSGEEEGEVLEAVPAWLARTHWITIALLVMGLIYVILAKVDETTTGPVLVRARSKIALSSSTGGLVRSVEVSAGDRVRSGDLLLQFYDPPTTTSLERLRGQLRAPTDGMVSDIRVRAGQQISPGDQVASIVDESAGYELIAMVPGSYAPQIHPGMTIVLKLTGYPDSHEFVTIERVGSEIVGPHEAARYAGRESTDALTVAGPVLIVHSTLPRKFTAGDRLYPFQDGMTGAGEVRVRSERMIVSLVPGLKKLLATKE